MPRYKIWDMAEPIVTPVGKEYTPEQWLDRFPWAKRTGVKMIIGGGNINGSVVMEFESTVERYKKRGCHIDESTMTDEEILQAIEDFEDNPPAAEPDVTERMVALQEYKAMIETDGYQAPKGVVEKNFKRGLWTESMVGMAVAKGSLTESEKIQILEIPFKDK